MKKEKIRIGIDIDGVLTNLRQFHIDYASKYCCENNINFSFNLNHYDIANTLNITKEEEKSFWDEYLNFYAKEEIIRPFAKEILDKLKNDGNEIYIITARWNADRDDEIGENMRSITKNWLYENSINYDKLIFVKDSKLQSCIDNKIDLMIEDDSKNIDELAKKIPVICYDAEYNRKSVGNNIIRCYSWYDIYSKINNKKGNI